MRRNPVPALSWSAVAALATAVGLLVSIPSASGAKKHALRLKLLKGEVLTWAFEQSSVMNTGVAGMAAIEMMMTSRMTYDVRDVHKSGNVEVEGRIHDMRIEGASVPMMSDLASDLSAMRVDMVLTPRGEVVELEVRDVPPKLESMRSSVEDMMRGFMPLPKKPVGPGDSWPSDKRGEMAIPGAGAIHYTLAGRSKLLRFEGSDDDRVAIVSNDIEIKMDSDSGAGLTLTGSGSGTSTFHVGHGRWLRSTSNMRMNVAMMGVEMTMDVSQEVILEK